MAQTNHITIKYKASRERKIRKDYENEKAKARQIPISFAQSRGDELINTEFTANELLALDKTIRETLGSDYQIVNVKYSDLGSSGNGKSYVTYAIIHKDLFIRSKARWDNEFETFCYGKTPVVIPAFPKAVAGNKKCGQYSTEGYIWLTFQKVSNAHTIMYRSDDVETFGFKGKYKRRWDKAGHLYWVTEVLFDKYLESIVGGIKNVKAMFEKFV
jgi:hypothetical protein